MCGIAGIVSGSAEATQLAPSLSRMHRALGHRGPDDRGEWVSPDCRASFVHTRLSIIDLTPAGHQPMTTADGRFTITFNGEIYNYPALRHDI